MSIIRTCHDKQNQFTMLNNQALFDPNLTNAARGLWAQCMARKEDWVFYISEIANHTLDCQDAIYSQINQLIEAGYVARMQVKEKVNGKIIFRSVEYIFFESKINSEKKIEFLEEFRKTYPHSYFLEPKTKDKKSKKCFPHRGFPDTDFSDREIPPLSILTVANTDLSNIPPLSSPPEEQKKPKKKPDKKISLRSEEEEIYKILEDTILSLKEKKRLTAEYSEEQVTHALEISKTQKVRKSLMGLLINILENPQRWHDPEPKPQRPNKNDPDDISEQLQERKKMALKYNELLSNISPTLAKKNENLMFFKKIEVFLSDGRHQISFQSDYFDNDLKEAMKIIEERIKIKEEREKND